MKKEDLTGWTFGNLTVVRLQSVRSYPSGASTRLWLCKCSCGKETVVSTSNLKSGHTTSCGCAKSKVDKSEDLTGKRFGRLVAIERADNIVQPNGAKVTVWRCKCDCGNETLVRAYCLKVGTTKSCGCYRQDVPKTTKYVHGGCARNKRERLYAVWNMMKQRCNDPNNRAYKQYGGRGIKVCAEWEDSYEAFRLWSIANGYDKDADTHNCTIDRIDNNGNYCPENCRWVNAEAQANNTRNNKLIEFNGEIKTLAQWAKDTGINRATIADRIKRGWTIKDALSYEAKKGVNQYGEHYKSNHS